jgi:hypothetical protein
MNAQEKQAKYEWMIEFYTQAAKGEVVQFDRAVGGWTDTDSGPSYESMTKYWRIKPALQIIDLTPLMWSGLDCEFWNDDQQTPTISPLISMDKEFLEAKENYFFENCQPRMSPYIHFWGGESAKCPIPEGFEVRYHTRGQSDREPHFAHYQNHTDIIGIEFIAVKDGYTLAAQ